MFAKSFEPMQQKFPGLENNKREKLNTHSYKWPSILITKDIRIGFGVELY